MCIVQANVVIGENAYTQEEKKTHSEVKWGPFPVINEECVG